MDKVQLSLKTYQVYTHHFHNPEFQRMRLLFSCTLKVKSDCFDIQVPITVEAQTQHNSISVLGQPSVLAENVANVL